ncbi:MAG TPA: ATP-binding protein [Candidatus Sulfotelmatobacter sp.]|nr:ATP-binding protein [Candidatus Sulfotelmatobacter sp.]
MILAFAMLLFIGIVDYATGRDFHLAAFYLIPICYAGWNVGQRAGLLMAFLSIVAWFLGDLALGSVYRHPLTPYWNGLMLLVLYMVIVILLSAFQRAHYHLEEVVQQRTAALQAEITERKRLEIAKLQAERLATVGTMAAQVAHEVRNPLGSITLNLDLLQKEFKKVDTHAEAETGEAAALLTDIREEIQRIKRVIEDYLKFARLPKPQIFPLALNEFLEGKLAFMAGEFDKARVKLRTSFDPDLKTINADGEQLWQATLNLIRNSLEAMPAGGELTIGTWRQNGQVQLRVTDKGLGMNKEELSHVFTPFFTKKSGGTGLGLTLVQQIAIEHGGHVECESQAGKGTTFTIHLPLTEKS